MCVCVCVVCVVYIYIQNVYCQQHEWWVCLKIEDTSFHGHLNSFFGHLQQMSLRSVFPLFNLLKRDRAAKCRARRWLTWSNMPGRSQVFGLGQGRLKKKAGPWEKKCNRLQPSNMGIQLVYVIITNDDLSWVAGTCVGNGKMDHQTASRGSHQSFILHPTSYRCNTSGGQLSANHGWKIL